MGGGMGVLWFAVFTLPFAELIVYPIWKHRKKAGHKNGLEGWKYGWKIISNSKKGLTKVVKPLPNLGVPNRI
jgi:hypothetical protein